jgi:WhiB family redox-sensing transcriptional regulator
MNHPADVLNLLRMHGGNRHEKVTHEEQGGTGYMVGQSAAATGPSYVYDPTSAGLGNFQAQPGPVASITGLFVDPIGRRAPTDLLCREQDPDLWFSEHPARLEMAKSFCAVCPARLGCLAGAIARREPWGVWGGEIFERGEIVAQKRARGRPRKRDIAA